MKKLSECPICHKSTNIGYACGEYFAYCSSNCPSPACFHPSENTTICSWEDWVEWYCRAQQEQPNEPLTLKRFEAICESVHNGWWEEKKRQGVTKHPDMLPYSELAEEVKEYDRVTVRRVLDALRLAYRRRPEQEG